MNAADVIAARLAQAGCRFAFGMPGGEVLTLMDAIARAGIRFQLVKHENAGGFMAEGTHHVTGAPAVLLTTIGPGLANAVNVVANAQQDRVPMIVLSGCVDAAEATWYTHQVFDHGAVLRPLVKATITIEPAGAAAQIDRALALATADPPGPVHIDVPISAAAAPAMLPNHDGLPRPARQAPAEGPQLAAAREALVRAVRPVMVCGLEVLTHGAADKVAAVARHHAMPTVMTYKAKGVLPETDALSLGGAGLSPVADRVLLPLIEQADLVLLAGYDPIEMRAGWRDPWDPASQTVLELAAWDNPHGMHRASHRFVGDIGAGLEALADGIKPPPRWPGGEPARARTALARAFRLDEAWGPAAVADEVCDLLADDGIATVDSGAHRIVLSQVWRCRRPHTLLQSTGLCTMGCSLPLAIGAKLAAPERQVVAFTGDAGLEMVLGELATLRDLKLGLPIVVFVDRSLALIELKQRSAGLANLGVDFGQTDWIGVAQSLGGVGVPVHDRAGLREAVREAFHRNTFTIVAAELNHPAYDGRI